jgi:hypothetical protein
MAPAPTSSPTREQILDTLGDLKREQAVWTPKEKQLNALSAEIQSWYPNLGANETAIASGARYDIQIGERAMEKTWASKQAVCKAAGGLKGLLKLCTVTYKALSGAIGNDAAAALQVETQTGHRKLKAVARIAATAEVPLDKAA